MKIVLTVPRTHGVLTGNRCTAEQWATQLRALGHDVEIRGSIGAHGADAIFALHAVHSHDSLIAFTARFPGRPAIVVLTGSDIYPELSEATIESIRLADRAVVLQPRAKARVPVELQSKVRCIVQAVPVHSHEAVAADPTTFDVCVVGQLRTAKDSLRAAAASRLLPAASKVRVLQAGIALEPEYAELIQREQKENPRFCWLRQLDRPGAEQLMRRSRVQVVSSRFEGGGRVIGESIVAGTPLLAARNDATLSLLGEEYEGFFDVGDTEALAALMQRVEEDRSYLDTLRAQIAPHAPQFDPALERTLLGELLDEFDRSAGAAS